MPSTKRQRLPRALSEGEERLAQHLLTEPRIPAPLRQYRFAQDALVPRRWLADFCWPDIRLMVEVEGGIFSQGRHARGSGIESEMAKHNQAVLMGYRILRVSTGMVKSGEALRLVKLAHGIVETVA